MQVIDIVLIILIIIIVLHLFYNGYLVSSLKNCKKECMAVINKTKSKDNNVSVSHSESSTSTTLALPSSSTRRPPRPSRIGDTYTNEGNLPWYDVSNRLLDEREIPKNDVVRMDNNKMKMGNDSYKIVFGDQYEGRLTSDPYEVDLKKVPEPVELKGFNNNNISEVYVSADGKQCKISEDHENMKRYIRDNVLGGKNSCECVVDKSKSEFTRDEIDKYREGQIEFRNKIYGTSAPADDPVDKMNRVVNNGGMCGMNGNGMKVSDMYDNLVTPDHVKVSNLNGNGFFHGSPLPRKECIKAPIIETNNGVPYGNYIDKSNGNNRYMTDNWMYNGENPNNGGKMYGGLMGNDPMMEANRSHN